jgi:CRP/FNR family transcriptional regulator, cyclic AMP receptor protein
MRLQQTSKKAQSSSLDQLEGLYSHLSPTLRTLAMRGMVRSYAAKSLLINEGEEGDSLFVLLKGSVKVFSMDTSGREITYGKSYAGDYFGEMSLDGGPRSASVVTLEPCTCAVLTRAALSEHLAVEPEFAISLLVQVIRRARAATEAARSMALLGVFSRVAAALEAEVEALPDQPDQPGRATFPIVLEPITHQDIASRVGASREMISRLLKDLEKGGYIEMGTKRITLLKVLPSRW